MTYLQASNAVEDAEIQAKISRRKTMLIEKQEKMQTEAFVQIGNNKNCTSIRILDAYTYVIIRKLKNSC